MDVMKRLSIALLGSLMLLLVLAACTPAPATEEESDTTGGEGDTTGGDEETEEPAGEEETPTETASGDR